MTRAPWRPVVTLAGLATTADLAAARHLPLERLTDGYRHRHVREAA